VRVAGVPESQAEVFSEAFKVAQGEAEQGIDWILFMFDDLKHKGEHLSTKIVALNYL